MKIVKNIYNWFARIKYKKYIVVLVFGVLIVGFVGEDSVVAHLDMKSVKSDLQKEKNYWEAEHLRNQEVIDQLNNDPKAVIRKARELYYMKTDDEDIFILMNEE